MTHTRALPKWRVRLQAILLVLLLTGGVGLALSSELLVTRHLAVQEGQAAAEDIAAPRRIEFVSDILTERERVKAQASVSDVYEPLDRQVGREQVYLAQQVLDFIDAVRADPYASPTYRRDCLGSIESVRLSPRVISDTLQLSEVEWRTVQGETRQVLAQVMREEIKTGQEDLYRRNVRAMISFELTEAQTAIVNEIVSALVRVNRAYNAQATEAARRAAMDSVPPQVRVLEANEIVLRSGEIVSAEDVEALQALGLLNPQVDWLGVSGSFLFALLLAVCMGMYLWYSEPRLFHRPRHVLLLLVLMNLFTLLAKWGTSRSFPQVYMVPLATLGMLVAVLLNVRLGLVAHILMCVVVGYVTGGKAELFVYCLAGGVLGIFALRRANRINAFVRSGLWVIGADAAVVSAFFLLGGELDTRRLGQLMLASVVNGGFSALLTLGGYYMLGALFDITTTLQLIDLARPTHPLMHQLLLKAPGTYHHSIMVGNMAEQAAEAIGADALLARVGAFYHDIGKTLRPYFFSENQMDGTNPHDLLDPETSSHIIRSHTSDGLLLARRQRLPRTIQAFIAEHHGTSKVGYFYHKASKEYGEENVDIEDYRYPGPRPESRETAIVMMADSCEAAVRSVRPPDPAALEELVRRIIADCISNQQLDDAPLTLNEISIVTSSFIHTLQGVFHARVTYPAEEGKEVAVAEEAQGLDETEGAAVDDAGVALSLVPTDGGRDIELSMGRSWHVDED